MAQIRLVVNTDLKQAKAAVDTLKTSFADLAKQLSTITVNKNLTAQLNALTKYYDSVANAGARAAQQTRGTAANVETLRRGYANLINQLNTLQKQYASGTFDTARKSIEQNFEAVKKLSQAQEVNGDEVNRLSGEYKKLAADVAQFRAEGEKLKTSDPFSPKQGDSIFRLQKQYASLLNSIKSAEQYYPKGTFDGIAKGAQEAVTGLQALGQEYTTTGTLSDASQKQLNTFSEGLNRQRAAFETTKNSAQNYHGTLRDIIQGFIKFQLAASIVMNSIQLIRSAFNSLNETLVETEKVVVSIQRVLDETVEGGKIADSLYNIAERLGQTFDNVQEIAQNFAKAGLSWQETLEATEAAVLALNVAELTAEESSEGLIAVMQQFNYEASELVNVIDVLNKAADKSAVDTQELLVALQKTGSYASAANLSLEETVGLISALSEATAASGQNIGNALKSLFSYTTRDSSLDTFASLSDEMNEVVEQYRLGAKSILDVWEQLSVEMQSLDAQQADALSQWTESSGLDAELEGELSEIYDSLTGVYDSAGVYRKNYFIALMNNFDEVKEVMGEISDAAGYTAEEQAKYMDTYEAKLNSLQAKWQHLVNDEQGWLQFKKDLLDLGSTILTVMEWTGGLRTTVLALGTAIGIVFGKDIISKITSGLNALKAGFASTATAAQKLNSALGIIGLIATALSIVTGIIDEAISKSKEAQEAAEQAQIEANNAAIQSANEALEANKKAAQQYSEYAQEVEKYRAVLESATAQESEKADAQNSLLEIQNALIASNSDYADSLDLINGSIKEQLGLIEQLSEEQLKQQAQDWLKENEAAIGIAESTISGTYSNTTGSLASGLFTDSDANRDEILRDIISASGVGNIASVVEDNIYGFFHNEFVGFKDGFWEGLGQMVSAPFQGESYVGGFDYSLAFSGTTEQQISAIESLIEYIGKNGLSAGLTNEEVVSYTKQLKELLAQVNTEEYQQAVTLQERAQASQDLINGTITYAEYLEKVFGIVQDTNDTFEEQIHKIQDLKDDALEKFIDGYKELRDLQKESLDLEEKKQAVLEAEQALEDAKNARGVYRLNAETGQFEWVQDEKAVKDAEDDLNNAIENLQESVDTAIISELESGNATNESILAILTGIASTIDNEGLHEYLNQFLNYAKEQGIDLGNVSFDSGGIARGLGFLPKATRATESVNDPALTAKILSPTSNAQFDRYVRDMGIMFEQARTYTQAPVLQSTAGNNVVTTTNNSTYINGVKIGSDMMSKPFGEVLQMVSMVPTK